ncbi:uncharacterized protein LOC135701432 [Ochlerotatus camptorhynchus]|uniref:uncharacterized protein LOC135701432 n=1 Tax=Ochlerotatus camptorhynchus TaxID=644619 RepID=UPI0031E38F44
MAYHSQSAVPNQPKATVNEENVIDQVYLHPCLYDNNAEGYKDQATRGKAWDSIGNHLNVKGEQAKEAWEKLRRCFMNAIKRRRTKRMHPWRFEQKMAFLYNHIDPSKIMAKYDTDEQQYYSETDDKSFMEELEISSPKVCDRLVGESMIPLDSPGIKQEESSDGSYGPEQSQNRPVVRPLRPRSISGSSADANNVHPDQQSRPISNDQPEIAESSTQRRKRNCDEPCDGPREAAKKWRKQSAGTPAGSYIENEEDLTPASERDDIDMFFLSMAKTTKTLTPIEQARIKLQVSQIVLNAQIASLEQSSRE